MDNCTQINDRCLACVTGEAFWKGYSNAKFPQTDASYNSYQTNGGRRGGGIGGINNSKNFRTYGSSFTILKKSLTTFQPNISAVPVKETLGQDVNDDGVVTVILSGACSGCPSSTLTLKQGVENLLKQKLGDKIKSVVSKNR